MHCSGLHLGVPGCIQLHMRCMHAPSGRHIYALQGPSRSCGQYISCVRVAVTSENPTNPKMKCRTTDNLLQPHAHVRTAWWLQLIFGTHPADTHQTHLPTNTAAEYIRLDSGEIHLTSRAFKTQSHTTPLHIDQVSRTPTGKVTLST
jgi:hypothetical protein